MAFSMSQSNNAARLGSTSSAKVAGICLPPISNMEHLQKTIWPEAYAPDNAGVNGDFDTTVMRPFATVCLSRDSREGWLQRGKASRTFNPPFKRMQFPAAKISSESGNSYGQGSIDCAGQMGRGP